MDGEILPEDVLGGHLMSFPTDQDSDESDGTGREPVRHNSSSHHNDNESSKRINQNMYMNLNNPAIEDERLLEIPPSIQQSEATSLNSSIKSSVPSIITNASLKTQGGAKKTVNTGSGGLRLSTFDTSSSVPNISSTVHVVQQNASRPPSIINSSRSVVPNRNPINFSNPDLEHRSMPIAINRHNHATSHHRYDDDNASQISASSLATSFSKSFLFGFLNNKKKDALKSGGLISKEYWMKDETSTECFSCGRLFTTFRRKHHCRICGQIFCSNCTMLISGEKFNHSGKMRVCKTCLSFATEYNDSSDESSIMEESYIEPSHSHDNNVDQDSILPSTPIEENSLPFVAAPTPPPRMAIPATRKGESVEIPVSRSFNSRISSIHTTNFGRRKMLERKPTYHASSQRNLQDGHNNNNNHNNINAHNGNGNTSMLFRSNTETSFADYVNSHNSNSTFNFSNHDDDTENNRDSPSIDHQYSDSEDEGSMSLYAALHLDKSDIPEQSRIDTRTKLTRSNTRSLDRAQASLLRMKNRRKSKSVSRPANNLTQSFFKLNDPESYTAINQSSPDVSNSVSFITSREQNVSKHSSELNDVCALHLKNLLHQGLADCGVPNVKEWENTLILILRTIETVEYNVRGGDNLDIRQYIKLKRLAGGKLKDSESINGVVFSKTFALKTMPRHILNPRIALIMFPLEYMKTEQHFMSLEPVLAQEKEYLNKLVGRIVALNPDVVFVGASVSGLALQLLDEAGIAVASNMKPQVIERIARMTQADIVISMDKLALNLKLGTCESLDVKTFAFKNTTKTFMFLTGCDHRLGCTIIIRGGDGELLRKIKDTTEFMVYALSNLKLETALYRDNFIYLSQDFYNKLINEVPDTDGNFGVEFLNTMNKRLLSTSPTVKFDPPFLLLQARQIEHKLDNAKSEYDRVKNLKVASEFHLADLNIDLGAYKVSNSDLLRTFKYVSHKKVEFLEESFSIRARQWDLFSSFAPDLLDPARHQNIVFLYSMVSTKTATPCIGPHPLQIDFYWDNDMTLGQYVEHLIYSAGISCSEGCGGSLQEHYRSYVHGNGKVDVMVEKFQSRIPTLQNVILTWSYCKQCGHTSPFLPMSETTWKFSFGKYLELLFWSKKNSSTNLGNCSHDFAKDHIKYFSLNDLTVRMEYSTVDLLELIVPRTKASWKPDIDIKLKVELHALIQEKSNNFFNSILARLNRVKVDSISNDKMEGGHKRIEELKNKVTQEQDEVTRMISEIYNKTEVVEHLHLNSVLRFVQDLSVEWDLEFAEFEDKFLPSEKDIARITALQLKRFFMDGSDEKPTVTAATTASDQIKAVPDEMTGSLLEDSEESGAEEEKAQEISKDDVASTHNDQTSDAQLIEKPKGFRTRSDSSLLPQASSLGTKNSPKQGKVQEKVHIMEKLLNEQDPRRVLSTGSSEVQKLKSSNTSIGNHMKSLSSASVGTNQTLNTPSKKDKGKSSSFSLEGEGRSNSQLHTPVYEKKSFLSASASPTKSDFPKSIKPKFGISAKDLEVQLKEGRQKSISSNSSFKSAGDQYGKAEDSRVSKLTNYFDQIHFETLSREFEMQREKERLKLIQNRYKAAPVASSKPIVEIYKNVRDAVEEEDHSGAEQQENEEFGNTKKLEKFERDINNKKNVLEDGIKEENLKTEIPQTERVSLMKTLANFWADRSATLWKPLEYPLASTEHIFVDSDVIVREDEPSSLIAFCLSSSDYVQKIRFIRENKVKEEEEDINKDEHKETDADENEKSEEDNLTYKLKQEIKGNDYSDLESIMLKKTAVHLKYQFQEGGTLLSCKIFFAEQFDAFRRKCGLDDNFVQSLSRCIKWDSAGGKSGSAFLKTLDDRLVIKELSNAELDSFVKFAPSYFEYMAQALFHDLPTVIAKIFGFYQIQIKNPINGKNFKMDVLIMENLFYDRKTSRIFDLKGSMRNRHVEKTGKENEVLLDENMVEYIYESPLFVREYDKKLLRASLWNDTLFLAKMNVMDYSLVIGIDEENKNLTVGIIDCIRTFTWDKKLESWVKEKGLVGGGTKEPTVVTPRQYKNRFREAMDRYILIVPDCWYQGSNTHG